jgi:hypothetical protein
MFDTFLGSLTKMMNKKAEFLVLPSNRQQLYSALTYFEKTFIDLLLLQAQNNVSTVRKYLFHILQWNRKL